MFLSSNDGVDADLGFVLAVLENSRYRSTQRYMIPCMSHRMPGIRPPGMAVPCEHGVASCTEWRWDSPPALPFQVRDCDGNNGMCPNGDLAASWETESSLVCPRPPYLPRFSGPSIAMTLRMSGQVFFMSSTGPTIL